MGVRIKLNCLCLILLTVIFIMPASAGAAADDLLMPADLNYLGAFRLPPRSDGMGWEWGGLSMAYNPYGDPGGAGDGYPGSLFGIGNGGRMEVSEISIPAPVISPAKNVEELKTAVTLQPFTDVRHGMFQDAMDDIPHAGIAYLPVQGRQKTGKLYMGWGGHGFNGPEFSHIWLDTDLADQQTAGPWAISNIAPYSTTEYLFEIPAAWADAHIQGKRLATGRFRDGGQGGQGPAIIATGPWNEGNPPPPNTRISATPLLLYSSTNPEDPTDFRMNGYGDADNWRGAAWLTTGNKASVLIIGTKGLGRNWYGTPDRECHEACGPMQGWWAERFEGQMLFYSPNDLADVADGKKAPHEPQPYATMKIDSYLYRQFERQTKEHTGGAAFDRERGNLYVFEMFGDGDLPLVHVWNLRGGGTGTTGGGMRVVTTHSAASLTTQSGSGTEPLADHLANETQQIPLLFVPVLAGFALLVARRIL